ncbi:MAG TPA: type II secretion system protein GspL [Candidatus Binataceae bacterium]|nr:type II secretion system protein GspL [Candidatus Binataceae bacterium]
MAQRIMALEIDGDWVRAAIAERSWNTFGLIGLFEDQRASGENDLSAALVRLVVATGRPDIVVSALPGEFVAKRLLELPFKDRRRLNQVVPFALEEHLPFPVDDAVVAFARLGQEGDQTRVMAAYASRAHIKEHLELLALAGLDPKTVTLTTLALALLMARGRNGHTGSHLLVNVDHSSASIVLLDADGAPQALRTVATASAGNTGTTPLPVAFGATILNSVRQMMLANQIESDEAELVLTGSGSAAPRVRTQIAEGLAIKVQLPEDFDLGRPFGKVPPDAARFSGCLAMLIGELPPHPAELLNFRQGEFAFHGRTGDFAPLRLSAALAAGVALLALLHFFLGLSVGISRLNVINRQIVVAAAPALGSVAAASDARGALRTELAAMRKQLKLLGDNGGHGSPLDTLLAVSRAIGRGLPVEMTDVTIDAGTLKVAGKANSFATIDQIKRALQRSGYFGNIQVTDAKAAAEAGKVDFRLSAMPADAAGGTE